MPDKDTLLALADARRLAARDWRGTYDRFSERILQGLEDRSASVQKHLAALKARASESAS